RRTRELGHGDVGQGQVPADRAGVGPLRQEWRKGRSDARAPSPLVGEGWGVRGYGVSAETYPSPELHLRCNSTSPTRGEVTPKQAEAIRPARDRPLPRIPS